jgi:putative FmdB family regulatory protein
MPLYDYDCAACGRRVEVVHGVHAPGPTHCPNCGGGPLRKAITAAAVHYKGSGWAKKERRATAGTGTKTSDDAASTDSASTGDGETKDAGTTTPKPASDSDAATSPATAKPAAKTAGTGTATKAD